MNEKQKTAEAIWVLVAFGIVCVVGIVIGLILVKVWL